MICVRLTLGWSLESPWQHPADDVGTSEQPEHVDVKQEVHKHRPSALGYNIFKKIIKVGDPQTIYTPSHPQFWSLKWGATNRLPGS